MLLTLATTHSPATDLGYLLHKHPDRVHRFEQAFGTATVFFPEATAERCCVALLLETDPVSLVRREHAHDTAPLEQYVNDRPYVASSFLSVALGNVFRTALTGRCEDRAELAASAIPLEATISVLPCQPGEAFLRTLFEPLGYSVGVRRLPLDPHFPDWGDSPYYEVTLTGVTRVADMLAHLYVLMPVLDNDKHYWVGPAEVEKLLRHGGDWLARHPRKDVIARRYLRHKSNLAREALARLVVEDDPEVLDEDAPAPAEQREAAIEAPVSLNTRRLQAVISRLLDYRAQRVVDLGCGEGRLLAGLLQHRQFRQIAGVDVSSRALARAEERLRLDRMAPPQRERISLIHGPLVYRDARLRGFDAATAVEVIEHLDPFRLEAFERVLFECVAAPLTIVTTPNVEYNVKFETLPRGQLRHGDHRFEWTRAEFAAWAQAQARRFGYRAELHPIGDEDPDLGAPTQMAVFERLDTSAAVPTEEAEA